MLYTATAQVNSVSRMHANQSLGGVNYCKYTDKISNASYGVPKKGPLLKKEGSYLLLL